MTIRTISQLPPVEGDIDKDSLIEISEPTQIGDDKGYINKRTSYEKIRSQLQEEVKKGLVDEYSMNKEDGSSINVSELRNDVDSIKDGTAKLLSANFETNPQVTNANPLPSDNQIPTVSQIRDTIIPNSTLLYIGPSSNYENAKTPTGFFNNNPEMNFSIDSGNKESNAVPTPKTGNAVIYGWVAENGSTISTNAWVGLFGYINDRWILLQLQPWIIGSKSSILQYIGFNVAVKKGLKLKIITGFPVNGSNSTSQGDIGWGINVVNHFAGYIIH